MPGTPGIIASGMTERARASPSDRLHATAPTAPCAPKKNTTRYFLRQLRRHRRTPAPKAVTHACTCEPARSGRSTLYEHLHFSGNTVTGDMAYHFASKDSNKGAPLSAKCTAIRCLAYIPFNQKR